MRRRLITALALIVLAAPMGVSANEGGGKKAKQSYLPLRTVAASIVRTNGRRGVLTVEVGIDATDAALRDKAELYQPMLRSAYVSALQPYALGLGQRKAPNADYISLTLQRETDKVLGQKGAKLLLGTILVN